MSVSVSVCVCARACVYVCVCVCLCQSATCAQPLLTFRSRQMLSSTYFPRSGWGRKKDGGRERVGDEEILHRHTHTHLERERERERYEGVRGRVRARTHTYTKQEKGRTRLIKIMKNDSIR